MESFCQTRDLGHETEITPQKRKQKRIMKPNP